MDTIDESTEKPTVYRSPGTLISGGLTAVLGLIFAIGFMVSSDSARWAAASVAFAIAVFGFVLGIYPAAYSDDRRLRVRNPFRMITLPWHHVDEVVARLSLEARCGAEKYTVWAIPVSMHQRKKADRREARSIRDATRTSRGQRPAKGLGVFGAPPPQPKMQIEDYAFVDQAVMEMEERRAAARAKAQEALGDVDVHWTWFTLGPCLVSLALIAIAFALR